LSDAQLRHLEATQHAGRLDLGLQSLIERIVGKLGMPALVDAPSAQLSGSDLTSLLLEVMCSDPYLGRWLIIPDRPFDVRISIQ